MRDTAFSRSSITRMCPRTSCASGERVSDASRRPRLCPVVSRMRSSSVIILRRTRLLTRANSATSLTGLVRKSSAPASRPCTRSEGASSAVTMTTGTWASSASAFMRRQTSKPSMPGIITSRRTRSGLWAEAAFSASGPLDAVTTSKYSAESLASSSFTLAAMSSTTRMRAVTRMLPQAAKRRTVSRKPTTEMGLEI